MHTLTTREVEKAAGLVEQDTRAKAHRAVVSGQRTQEDADKELGRWLNCTRKAMDRIKLSCIDSSNITVWWPIEDPHTFGFESSTRNVPYEASVDLCECEGFKHGNPCWHRAGVAILQRAAKLRREAGERPAWGTRRRPSPAEIEAAAQEMFG